MLDALVVFSGGVLEGGGGSEGVVVIGVFIVDFREFLVWKGFCVFVEVCELGEDLLEERRIHTTRLWRCRIWLFPSWRRGGADGLWGNLVLWDPRSRLNSGTSGVREVFQVLFSGCSGSEAVFYSGTGGVSGYSVVGAVLVYLWSMLTAERVVCGGASVRGCHRVVVRLVSAERVVCNQPPRWHS